MTSMAYNAAAGLSNMLKDGTQHFSNEDGEASVVKRNIEACLQLCQMLSTSLGPQGRCKLVVNHLGKITVTSDCAGILKEVEVEHPAAKLLQMACQKQEEACGDGTNLVVSFGGELLWNTLDLIHKMGWQHASDMVAGFTWASQHVQQVLLPSLVCGQVTNLQSEEDLLAILKPVMMTKQMGSQDFLAPLVAKACLLVMRSNHNKKLSVSPESVRTVKILGSSVSNSTLVEGYVAQRGLESHKREGANVKICVFACGIEASSTEAKGTVLMKNADDLLNYNKTEEAKMEEMIEGIAAAGVHMVVSGGTISDMAMHFIDKYKLLCLKVNSKWELRRLCQAVGATALVRVGPPTPEEVGFCSQVSTKTLGDRPITVFSQEADGEQKSKLATIVLRASTTSVLADLERAVEDGVRAIQMACKDPRYVYGGGCTEMAMAVALEKHADTVPGLEQYAIRAFAKSLQVVARTLAENAGSDARVPANLQAAHAKSTTGDDATMCDYGVDINSYAQGGVGSGGGGGIISMKEEGIVDLLITKMSALRLAVDGALTVLKIDQIIMSKPSGGPKM